MSEGRAESEAGEQIAAGTLSQRAVCGAKTRDGDPCKNAPMLNGRCRMHGGATPRGPAHGAFKTGRHSKSLPHRLAARYEEAMADETLLEQRSEIALLDVRIDEVVRTVDAKRAPAVWDDLCRLLDQRRKLVESERRRMVEMHQMLTTEEAMTLLAAVVDSLRRHVVDRKVLAAVSADLTRLVAHTPRGAAD